MDLISLIHTGNENNEIKFSMNIPASTVVHWVLEGIAYLKKTFQLKS